MKNIKTLLVLLFLVCAYPAFAIVTVTTPSNNSTVGTSVPVKATTSTTCGRGVAASGVYVDNTLTFVVSGNVVDTTINIPVGKHYVVVQEWDYCGASSTAPLNLTISNAASVAVTSPVDGAMVSKLTPITATGTSSCPFGVSAMGVYVNNKLVVQQHGSTLNTTVALEVGKQAPVVQEWDNCGGSTTKTVNLTVTGTTIKNIQAQSGWNRWGQMAPDYQDCDLGVCPGLTWSMSQHQAARSLSGDATQFNIEGTTPYADVLFSNPVIGQGNQQGLTDSNHSLLPTIHNFQLDQDTFVTNWADTQALEFDVNWFGNSIGMEWGTQCNHLGGNVWDYWDNANAHWVHTTAPCDLKEGQWNHVTLNVQRLANNYLLYQSITVNNVVHTLNITVPPMAVPASWWGVTVNFQMDGDYAMHSNTASVDNMNLIYW